MINLWQPALECVNGAGERAYGPYQSLIIGHCKNTGNRMKGNHCPRNKLAGLTVVTCIFVIGIPVIWCNTAFSAWTCPVSHRKICFGAVKIRFIGILWSFVAYTWVCIYAYSPGLLQWRSKCHNASEVILQHMGILSIPNDKKHDETRIFCIMPGGLKCIRYQLFKWYI